MPPYLPILVFVLSLVYLTQVVAFAIQSRVDCPFRGIGWWLAGSTGLALGHILLSIPPGTWASFLGWIANPVSVAGRIAILVGVLRFLERGVPWRRLAVPYAATLVCYYLFVFAEPSIAGRASTITAAGALFSLLTAAPLLAERRPRFPAGSARFTGAVLLLHGVFLAVVSVCTAVGPAMTSYAQYGPIQVAVFIVPAVTGNLCTFGLILMVNQRLSLERREEERRRADLEDRNRRLQKTESLGRMAGAVAHHFNNKLHSVLLNLELAGLQAGGDAGPYLRQAQEATERAADLGRLMLAYLGQTSGLREPQSIGELCRGCRTVLEELLPECRLNWEVHEPGPEVLANGPELQQVLSNLVTNAAEATEGGRGPVQVRTTVRPAQDLPGEHRYPLEWQPGAEAYVCLEVTDRGPGIADAEIDQLFDPFFSTKRTGRGLGLPVALGIVQAHGGALAVASRPGRGSTFTVLLPVHPGR
jgi:signal transduction histidine kinase